MQLAKPNCFNPADVMRREMLGNSMPAHAIVRCRTAATHSLIDAAFSRFNLGDRRSYVAFLQAHARVVLPIEAVLSDEAQLPPWRPRTALLARDLDALGYRLPMSVAQSEPWCLAAKFGLLYVLEGSRLGNRILLRRAGASFSTHYLRAAHEPGEWRAFTEALNGRAEQENATWLEAVVAGATNGFQLYASSASEFITAS
jgi:heme oxygenase